MSNREINESPERTTAGLSSAIQIVDFTGAETYAIGNTSCLSPVIGSLIRGIGLPHEESEHASRKADFKTAMHESLQKNESIIAELAKY
ncbi:MAG: hypothetical protein NTX81_00095 [Candidatus Bathyarchaeota archaeon]|nr:hypothetical protein [Candidatus Bathyarchaeota archaeon]